MKRHSFKYLEFAGAKYVSVEDVGRVLYGLAAQEWVAPEPLASMLVSLADRLLFLGSESKES